MCLILTKPHCKKIPNASICMRFGHTMWSDNINLTAKISFRKMSCEVLTIQYTTIMFK